MTTSFENPSREEICRRLRQIRTVAVVGLSPRSDRPSYVVAQALQRFGCRIVPVRPAVDSILGEPACADLQALPGPVDLVDVFRAPEYVDEIVDACIALNVPALWLQEGVVNAAAAQRARAAGIWVVMDRCIYKDWLGCGNALSNGADSG
ncbi:CoA-binding protein [Sulfurivermis fontis]|jgi:predicted CoA-binding protein|uniref:CoA-binding protein n=1 Tax=Sulfurivermis fontis TaxID=1972068 RepID=UPI000FDBC8AC|nr:CoA-binding protein [Sulfurivermis fontis]